MRWKIALIAMFVSATVSPTAHSSEFYCHFIPDCYMSHQCYCEWEREQTEEEWDCAGYLWGTSARQQCFQQVAEQYFECLGWAAEECFTDGPR